MACENCGGPLLNRAGVRFCTSEPCVKAKRKDRYDKEKKAVFEHYGLSCACCGENEYLFLSLDHINNDGYIHKKRRQRQASGIILYREILKEGFPDDLQTLCHNCNGGKRSNGGICPHQER